MCVDMCVDRHMHGHEYEHKHQKYADICIVSTTDMRVDIYVPMCVSMYTKAKGHWCIMHHVYIHLYIYPDMYTHVCMCMSVQYLYKRPLCIQPEHAIDAMRL